MSVVSKLKRSRTTWKEKAVERNNELKYQRAEAKRLKADRNKYKAELQDMKRQLAEEQKKTPFDSSK
jgi:predicted  nucleic acid-binding Zn-ribbon protein